MFTIILALGRQILKKKKKMGIQSQSGPNSKILPQKDHFLIKREKFQDPHSNSHQELRGWKAQGPCPHSHTMAVTLAF